MITVPIFLRTAVTFCMFAADDLVKFVFAVVTQNILAHVERSLDKVPVVGKAGARGIDRLRNKSVYWTDAVPWTDVDTTKGSADRISVRAFCNLLFTLHAPTSALATTVKQAINKAHSIAMLGTLRLFQFRQIATEFPTLLSPVFQLQSSMRTKLLGEDWWASKRQIFADARAQVQNEEDLKLKCVSRRERVRARVRRRLTLPFPPTRRYKIIEKQEKKAEADKLARLEAARQKRKLKMLAKADAERRGKKREGDDDDDDGTGTGTDTDGTTGTGTGTGTDTGTRTHTDGGSTRTATGVGNTTAAAAGGDGKGRSVTITSGRAKTIA